MLSQLELAVETSEFSVHDYGTALPAGSQESLRQKFALRQQRKTLATIVSELEDGSLYLGDWTKGEIEIVGLKRVVQNRFWSEVEHTVYFPPKEGDKPGVGSYRSIRWNSGRMPGVKTLAFTKQNEIVLLRSFRHAARRWCLELPGGAIKPDESILDCARREALEECGVTPSETSHFQDFGVYDADTGVLMADAHIVYMSNVDVDENKCNRDVSESTLGPVVMPLERVLELVGSNEIRDGFVHSALLQAKIHGLVQY